MSKIVLDAWSENKTSDCRNLASYNFAVGTGQEHRRHKEYLYDRGIELGIESSPKHYAAVGNIQ